MAEATKLVLDSLAAGESISGDTQLLLRTEQCKKDRGVAEALLECEALPAIPPASAAAVCEQAGLLRRASLAPAGN